MMHMLRIHDDALSLVRSLAPTVRALGTKSRNLQDQLTRALDSVVLNIAEGSYAQGRKRHSHYFIAMASAREAWSALQLAEAWGHTPPITPDTTQRIQKIIGTLHKIVH